MLGQSHLARGARTQLNLTFAFHGLRGVAHNIEHCLDQLFLIAVQIGQAGIIVALDTDTVREFGQHQGPDPFQHFVNVQQRELWRAVRREQAIEQHLQAVGFLDDDLGVFAQLGAFELALQQLRRPAQTPQRISDLVREIADELAVCLLLIHLPLLARELELLIHRAKLDQKARGAGLRRRNQAIQMQARLCRAREGQVAAGVAPVMPQHFVEADDELRGIGEQMRQWLANHVLQAEREQVFRSRIGIDDAQIIVYQKDRGSEQIEAGKRAVSHMRSVRNSECKPSAATQLPCRRKTRLPGVAEFLVQSLDVLLVPLDLILVGLQPVEHFLVIPLVAVAHRFLLRQVFLGLGQRLLLAAELVLQNFAPFNVTAFLGGGVDPGKACRRAILSGCGRARIGWNYRYFAHHQGAIFAPGFFLHVGVGDVAVRVPAFESIPSRRQRKCAA